MAGNHPPQSKILNDTHDLDTYDTLYRLRNKKSGFILYFTHLFVLLQKENKGKDKN